jgi:hypothetical protein
LYLPKMVYMFFYRLYLPIPTSPSLKKKIPLIRPSCHKCISQNIKGTALPCIQDIVMVFWNLEAYKAKRRMDYSKFLRKISNPRSQYKVHISDWVLITI